MNSSDSGNAAYLSGEMPEREFAALERRAAKPTEALLDGFTMAMGDFDTATLLAIADYRDAIDPAGWYQRIIREYIEVWR